MNLLLDTHIFLWYISGDSQIPQHQRIAIQNPANLICQALQHNLTLVTGDTAIQGYTVPLL